MARTTIHLMRHGEVYNPEGILYGRLPGYHLSALGHQMAQQVADVLSASGHDITRVITSPLERARETGAPTAAAFGLVPTTDPRLIEAGNSFEGVAVNRNRWILAHPTYWSSYINPLRPSWGEPYREIVFDGKKTPYPAAFYSNTLTCYSFSKSLSVPGERIGYVAVHPKATEADDLTLIFGQISRGIGHNCPASPAQYGIADCIDQTSDLSVYETNMNLLYDALVDLGFTVTRPGGSFYIFPKCLEEDAIAFCNKAKKYDLILVPSDHFGLPGYFRMAYCLDTDKVRRSLPVLRRFVETEYTGRFL